jgi:hypothetical protein
MSYTIQFPNDYPMKVPNIDGFKMDTEFDDVVFGWWGDAHISVIKKDYKKFMEKNNEYIK